MYIYIYYAPPPSGVGQALIHHRRGIATYSATSSPRSYRNCYLQPPQHAGTPTGRCGGASPPGAGECRNSYIQPSSIQDLLPTGCRHAGIATNSPRAYRNCYIQPPSMEELLLGSTGSPAPPGGSLQELLHAALQHAGLATNRVSTCRNCYPQPSSIQELRHTALFLEREAPGAQTFDIFREGEAPGAQTFDKG